MKCAAVNRSISLPIETEKKLIMILQAQQTRAATVWEWRRAEIRIEKREDIAR
jgi:hypothetical protein